MCDTGSSSSGKDVSIHVTATETSKGVYEISYESTAEIEGFEVENCDLSDAYGGDAEDKGFYITTGSSSGIVIAFSFEGESITAGSGLCSLSKEVWMTSVTSSFLMMTATNCPTTWKLWSAPATSVKYS